MCYIKKYKQSTMNITFKHIKQDTFPEDNIYRQICRLRRKNGGINVGTWKYCTKVAKAINEGGTILDVNETTTSDMIFDTYKDHYAFYIKDEDSNKVLGWGLLVLGTFDYNPDKILGAIQFYSRPNIRGAGIGSKLFEEAIRIAEIEHCEACFYYGSNDNKFFFSKMRKKYVPKTMKLVNIYRNLTEYVGKKKRRSKIVIYK